MGRLLQGGAAGSSVSMSDQGSNGVTCHIAGHGERAGGAPDRVDGGFEAGRQLRSPDGVDHIAAPVLLRGIEYARFDRERWLALWSIIRSLCFGV
jgi:hypothetical protein